MTGGDDTLEEADLRTTMRSGSHLLEMMAVERRGTEPKTWVLYVRASWFRGWRPVMTYRKRALRRFNDVMSILRLRDRLGHDGPVVVRVAGSAELAVMAGVAAEDGGPGAR